MGLNCILVAFLFVGLFATASLGIVQWRSLIGTYGYRLIPDETHYVSLPMYVDNAVKEGWHSISGGDCTNGGRYNGHRFIKGDDYSFALLFDKNGFIAGCQANPLQNELVGVTSYPYLADKMYQSDVIEGNKVFVLTTYFVYPGSICTKGRTSDDIILEGTGTELYFQNGPTPCQVTSPAPRVRDLAYAKKYSKNQCYNGMGQHSYYNIDLARDTNCSSVRPMFLLYSHDDELHGFGYDIMGYSTSPGFRFEHPRKIDLYHGVGPSIPDCMLNANITTMHVWFIAEPWLFRCP